MTPNVLTVPVKIYITTLKPDITIIDKKNKTFNIFELTSPMEPNIKIRSTEKYNKYAHFLTDVTAFSPTLTCFEVGARGYVSKDNHTKLKTLHQFCKPEVKLRKFKENMSALAIYSSYALFCNRRELMWMDPGYLSPPFGDN